MWIIETRSLLGRETACHHHLQNSGLRKALSALRWLPGEKNGRAPSVPSHKADERAQPMAMPTAPRHITALSPGDRLAILFLRRRHYKIIIGVSSSVSKEIWMETDVIGRKRLVHIYNLISPKLTSSSLTSVDITSPLPCSRCCWEVSGIRLKVTLDHVWSRSLNLTWLQVIRLGHSNEWRNTRWYVPPLSSVLGGRAAKFVTSPDGLTWRSSGRNEPLAKCMLSRSGRFWCPADDSRNLVVGARAAPPHQGRPRTGANRGPFGDGGSPRTGRAGGHRPGDTPWGHLPGDGGLWPEGLAGPPWPVAWKLWRWRGVVSVKAILALFS